MAARKNKKIVSKTSSKHSFWMTVIVLLVIINAVFLASWMFSLNDSSLQIGVTSTVSNP